MYIRSLEISNLRGIDAARVEFVYPGLDGQVAGVGGFPQLPNVTLFLGINGSGKTTILRGIALAVQSPILPSSGFRPYALVSRRAGGDAEARSTAELVFHPQDLDDSKKEPELSRLSSSILRFDDFEQLGPTLMPGPGFRGFFNEKSPAFFLVGYGATRRVESMSSSFEPEAAKKSRYARYARIASLFEDHYALAPLSSFLPLLASQKPNVHRQAVALLQQLTPQGTTFVDAQERSGEYLFEQGGLPIPFGALSDGHKAYLGWISDLLYHLTSCCAEEESLVELAGVVLVDEIDLHIHPAWQRTIIPQIATTFPKLQFVLTSHSPLVVGTLEQNNLYLIHQEKPGKSPTVERPAIELHGLSADQILTSDVFGLNSTRAPAFLKILEETSAKATRGEPGAALELMQKLAHGSAVMAEDGAADDEEPPAWVRQLATKKKKPAAKKS